MTCACVGASRRWPRTPRTPSTSMSCLLFLWWEGREREDWRRAARPAFLTSGEMLSRSSAVTVTISALEAPATHGLLVLRQEHDLGPSGRGVGCQSESAGSVGAHRLQKHERLRQWVSRRSNERPLLGEHVGVWQSLPAFCQQQTWESPVHLRASNRELLFANRLECRRICECSPHESQNCSRLNSQASQREASS